MTQSKSKALTTGEVAKYCDVNFRTVIRWIERGVLDAYQLPGRGDNRIPVDAFLRFLEENNMPIPDGFLSRNQRVLIIEDEEKMARSIERVLKRSGFETEIAENGFIAGALLLSYKPALVTLDLRMPGLNGFDVLKFIRTKPELKHLKVLVVSGELPNQLAKAVKEGADDSLGKPFSNSDLEAKVKALVEPINSE